MIFVREKGRMCNNLLQYGHVYAWARDHGRQTLSMRFAYKYPYFHIGDTPRHNFFFYVLGKYLANWKLIPSVSFFEPETTGSREREQQMLRHKTLMVEGWYVRYYDLFLKYKKEILELFAFKDEVEKAVKETMMRVEDETRESSSSSAGADARLILRLGVHIRRGDYKIWMGGRYFYTDEVYIDYIRQFVALHPDQRVVVYICGNDPSLDRAKYEQALAPAVVNFPAGNPGEDLCLLSHCDYLIGAPSTFSLVAAMYRDLPLCWMEEAETVLSEESFGRFDKLFREIR